MKTPNHTHGGNIKEAAARHGIMPDEIIDFSASINPLGMSERARKAVIKGLDSVLHYPEQFADALTSEISKFHHIPKESIIPGNGSTELIYLVPRAFKPKRALIVIPTFSEYMNSLGLVGCEVETFLLSEGNCFQLDVERLVNLLKNKFDILYICNPGNPTGNLLPRKSILKIVDEAARYGTLCMVDEAFIDFVEEESVKGAAVERLNLIVLRSMTKFFGIPGLRVGFAVGCKENIDMMMICKEPWSINTLGSIAAIESLRDEEYIEKSRVYAKRELEHLFSMLAAVPWLTPFSSVVNYILLKIERSDLDSDILVCALARHGVLIRSCSSFDGLGNRFIRVAVRKREENERLIKLLMSLTNMHIHPDCKDKPLNV